MRFRLPSTQALQCFESSARYQSFTAAAQHLHLTQGAVSRQVLALEQLLGAALFVRGAQRLALTASGAAYLVQVSEALAQLEKAASQFKLALGQGGLLNLSIPSSWGNYWLIPRLPDFNQRYAQVGINLMTHVGAVDFNARNLDAAVEFLPDSPCEDADFLMPLTPFPYANFAWTKAYGPAFKTLDLDASQLLRHVTIAQAWTGWQINRAASNSVQSSPVIATGPSFEVMSLSMSAAVQGLGVALLPGFMAEPLVVGRKLKRLSRIGWQTPGGYWLRRSPFLRSEASYLGLREWLIGENSRFHSDSLALRTSSARTASVKK